MSRRVVEPLSRLHGDGRERRRRAKFVQTHVEISIDLDDGEAGEKREERDPISSPMQEVCGVTLQSGVLSALQEESHTGGFLLHFI